MMPKVSMVIVNWNREADTAECLYSLKRIDYSNHEIILVDNGSQDSSPDNIQRRFQNVKLIRNRVNKGFAEGNNVGIREALKRNADYILLLNNDTVVEADFLSSLVNVAEADSCIGMASPKINFYHDRDTIWFAGGSFLPFIEKPSHLYYGQKDIGQVQDVTETEWISGCCMLIKREVLEKIGLLDADYFNNYEDVDFCVRAKRAGYKIAVVPQAKIYHKFASSMGGKFSPFYTYFRTRNNLLFFKKTGQWLPLVLNFIVFPVYSIFESLRNREFMSVKTTFVAIWDFLIGRYGIGSARELGK